MGIYADNWVKAQEAKHAKLPVSRTYRKRFSA